MWQEKIDRNKKFAELASDEDWKIACNLEKNEEKALIEMNRCLELQKHAYEVYLSNFDEVEVVGVNFMDGYVKLYNKYVGYAHTKYDRSIEMWRVAYRELEQFLSDWAAINI